MKTEPDFHANAALLVVMAAKGSGSVMESFYGDGTAIREASEVELAPYLDISSKA